MIQYKIQSLDSLEQEMRAVARGEIEAPNDAAKPSYNTIEALLKFKSKTKLSKKKS